MSPSFPRLALRLQEKTMEMKRKPLKCLLSGRRFYIVAMAFCLLEWLALSRVAPNCWFDSDTVSYFYPVNLFCGRISAVRPPVYCLFLNALRCFGDIHLKTAVVLTQFAVLLGTILLAARMLRSLFLHDIPVLVVCGFLALQGYFWAKAILPECFSFCVVVLAVYLFWRMMLCPSKKLIWGLHLLLVFAIMIKPVFVIMAIALFLVWVFRIVSGCENKHHVKTVVCSYSLSIALVLGLSTVSLQNDLLDSVSSSAWTTCKDSSGKTLLAEEMGKSRDPYAGAFALQWAVIPGKADSTNIYDICPEFLFESDNVRYCQDLGRRYVRGKLYPLDALLSFIREAKHQPLYWKYELEKLFLGIGAPRGVLLWPFWLGVAGLVLALARRNHCLLFANLLLLGFVASVIFKSDMEQNERLLYPVYLVPWMDLLHYFRLAFPNGNRNLLDAGRP